MTTSSALPAVVPRTLDDAVNVLTEHPDLTIVAGGTDVMVGVNEGRGVDGWLSLRRVDELRRIDLDGPPGGSGPDRRSGHDVSLTLGAGVTFSDLLSATGRMGASHGTPVFPGALVAAARTIGSVQIRNAGTLGGNIVTASPAADAVPPLHLYDAELELHSARGVRRVPIEEFCIGPKRTSLERGELLIAVHLCSLGGVEGFAKVGARNAMVISVCSLATRLDPASGIARVAIGSAAPTVVRARAAESFLLDRSDADAFADAVVEASTPIDDHRATAAYRRHALAVLARRAHAARWREIEESAA
jgi:CO/xanthine dehydrogenase FAD-binding subunit